MERMEMDGLIKARYRVAKKVFMWKECDGGFYAKEIVLCEGGFMWGGLI